MPKLRSLLPPHRASLALASLLAIASAALALALASVTAALLGAAIAGTVDTRALASLVGLGALRIALGWGQGRLAIRVAHRLGTELRTLALDHALQLEADAGTSELTTRIAHDTNALQTFAAFRLPSGLADALTALVLVAYATSVDARTMLIASSPVLLTLPFALLGMRRSSRRMDDARTRYGSMFGAVSELVSARTVLRHFGARRTLARTAASSFASLEQASVAARDAAGLTLALVQGAALGGIVVVAWALAGPVARGEMTEPRALAVLAAITLAARPIARLVGTVSEAGTVLPSLRRVEELLARRAAPEPPAEVTRAPWRTIVVSELTVRRGERCVLDRLGLELRAGERVGITGENGTGKTTLLLALLDLVPHEGTTSIDGRPGSLASRCAWVPQDPALVEGTVLSNVTVGREPDRERALDALQQAGAAEWLAKRGGLEASIEVAGTNLSRGEKQRLCLARALYRDAPILVLDEPTASLDTAGVEAFVSLLGALVRDRTTVMVTHDERLLAACTRVLVLERGVLRPRARSLVDDGQPHT